ncbi:MAG: AAA family ATPase [Planctomycetota bacterium]|jgi:MoxR-like ATPase
MTPSEHVDQEIVEAGQRIQALLDRTGEVIVGQRPLLQKMILGLLCEGHVLVEGMPGLAKSLMVQSLARSLNAEFLRIQFTPDLLPADLTGTEVFDPKEQVFSIKKGPIFANLVLADEINRAPPKVQSALLEAMQERQVSLGGRTLPLPEPFMVLATQNPIEHEGTYPLPEAQVDRFLLKVQVPYPSREEEMEITSRMASTGKDLSLEPVMDAEEVLSLRSRVNEIYADEKIQRYAVDLVFATREPAACGLADLAPLIQYGASPRASIALILVARAQALLEGRSYVIPKDIKEVGLDVLRHRVIPSFEAEAEEVTSAAIVTRILESIEVP